MKRLIAVGLALLIAIPSTAFTCGMTTGHTGQSGGGGGKKRGSNPDGRNQTSRGQWTKKRMQDLKGRLGDHNKAQRTAETMDLMLHGPGDDGGASAAARRQHRINRLEFLALKRERRGKLSPDEAAEMQSLIHKLTRP